MKKLLKKGFTLVELIVVLMLMGIITTCIVMAIRPVTQLYADINYKYEEENSAITLFDFINGDLRYATKVNVVSKSSDDLLWLSAHSGEYKNFMMFSNDTRSISNKGARGYVKYGLTAGTADWKYVVSESLYGENDYQFSIDSYDTALGQQSLTITAEAHPMKMTADGAGFEVNKRKPYTYKEAIQFVNMRYAQSHVNHLTVNFNVSVNSSDKYIFILYSKPKDLPSAPVSVGPTGSQIGPHNDSNKKNKVVKYDEGAAPAVPGATPKLIVHFYNTVKQPYRMYKVATTGCTWSRSDGVESAKDQINRVTTDVVVTAISTGNTFRVLTDMVGGEKEIYKMDSDEFAALTGEVHKYIWYDDTPTPSDPSEFIHTDPYDPPGKLSPTKLLKIHYIPCDTDDPKIGLRIYDGDSVTYPSAKISFNGDEVMLPNGGDYFAYDGGTEIYVEVEFTMDDGAVHLKSTDEYKNVLKDYEVWGEEDITSPDGVREIWLYNGEAKENRDDLPLPDPYEKEILLHYMWTPPTADWDKSPTNGLVFKDKDGAANSSKTNEGAIPNNGEFRRKAEGDSFDITVTLIKSAAIVHVVNINKYTDDSTALLILNDSSADEYWISNGAAYENKSDVPGMNEVNKKINLHYLGGTDYTDGLAIIDNDSLTDSIKVGDDFVPNGGIYGWYADGGEASVTVTLVYGSSSAKVSYKSIGSDWPDDEPVIPDLNTNSKDDYWFYGGACYENEADAKAAKEAAEGGSAPESTEMSVTGNGVAAAVQAFYKRMAFVPYSKAV